MNWKLNLRTYWEAMIILKPEDVKTYGLEDKLEQLLQFLTKTNLQLVMSGECLWLRRKDGDVGIAVAPGVNGSYTFCQFDDQPKLEH
jgi:hypothetical protein